MSIDINRLSCGSNDPLQQIQYVLMELDPQNADTDNSNNKYASNNVCFVLYNVRI